MKKSILINYEEFDNYSELDKVECQMVERAFKMCESAYAPYSKFHVGATVLLSNGEFVSGNNQENIAYPSGLCAERVALFFIGANFPNETIKSITIVAKGDLVPFDKILSPCGGCRQVMVETESRQKEPIRVVLVSQNNKAIVFNSVKDLLPFVFGD